MLGAGFELVKANALKVFIVFLYTPFALAVFIWNNDVNYVLGFILAIGNMTGAFIGSPGGSEMGSQSGQGFSAGGPVLCQPEIVGGI